MVAEGARICGRVRFVWGVTSYLGRAWCALELHGCYCMGACIGYEPITHTDTEHTIQWAPRRCIRTQLESYHSYPLPGNQPGRGTFASSYELAYLRITASWDHNRWRQAPVIFRYETEPSAIYHGTDKAVILWIAERLSQFSLVNS